MTALRLLGDEIELDGRSIARLLPGLTLSLRDKLTEAFDCLDEEYVAELEDRIAQLEARLAPESAEATGKPDKLSDLDIPVSAADATEKFANFASCPSRTGRPT